MNFLVMAPLLTHLRKCATGQACLSNRTGPCRVGKVVQTLQSVKNYSNSRVHGQGRLGEITLEIVKHLSAWFRIGLGLEESRMVGYPF
jgi:hypothetical protein